MLNNLIYWKLAVFKYFSGVTKIGAMAFMGGTAEHVNPKVQLYLAAYVAMMTFTEGFLDQTAAKLASGKPPVGTNGSGNTEHFVNPTPPPPNVPPSPKP